MRTVVPVIVASIILFVIAGAFLQGHLSGGVVARVASTRLASCSDTDGGNDYTLRGTVTLVFQVETAEAGQEIKQITDRCSDSQNLYEYNCPTDGSPHSVVYRVHCPCADGQCRVKSRTVT